MSDGPTFSVRVMHVRDDAWRRANVLDLRRRLGPTVDYREVVDPARRGCLRTFIECLAVPLKGASHALVLCDDTGIMPPQLTPELARAMTANPATDEHLTCLCFTHDATAEAAARSGGHWGVGDGIWMYGLVVPTALRPPMLRWITANVDPTYRWDDWAVQAWMEAAGERAWFPYPCLVDHLGAGKSLVGNDWSSQHKRWASDSSLWSAPVEDWSAGVDRPFRVSTTIGHYRKWFRNTYGREFVPTSVP